MKTLVIIVVIIFLIGIYIYKGMPRNVLKSIRRHYNSVQKRTEYFIKEIIPADEVAQDRGVLRKLKVNLNSSAQAMLLVFKRGLERDLRRIGRMKFRLEKASKRREADEFDGVDKFFEKHVWNDDDLKELISLESDINDLLAKINKVM